MGAAQALKKTLKSTVKQALWHAFKGEDGLTDVTVLSGPTRGTRLRVDLRCEAAYWLGTYDSRIVSKLAGMLRPGQVAFDCGAFLGAYAAAMRNAVGPTGVVHVFEASAKNFARVSRLPTANGWSNVHVHHLAVGEAHSKIRFATNLGAASGPVDAPGKQMDLSGVEVEEVECSGIDELVYERGLPAPDFLKLDLETAEVFALANGDRLWREKRPSMLIELHKTRADPRPPTFVAAERFLREYGYAATEAHLGIPVATVRDFVDAEARDVQCTLFATPR
ncbi:MAG: FkbM family methyltransferase [Polyangiales bacterium]